ncbi:MAG TPA: hypothetical protein DHV12_08905 [Thermotogae bacterium]|nr:type transport system permease protein [Thermotogota bacterium]HCZ07226.1 hypothetical protein [Thermotogota bacterium]
MKKSILKMILAFFLEDTRDFGAAVWIYIFPILLLTILVSIFSNVGKPENMRFDIGLVVTHRNGIATQAVLKVFEELSIEHGGMLHWHEFSDLEDAIDAMKKRHLVAVVEIPEDFDRRFASNLLAQRMGLSYEPAVFKVHTMPGKETGDIVVKILQSVARSISKKGEGSSSLDAVRYVLVESSSTFRYVDWIVPGVLLMAFMTVGLFGVGSTLVYMRRKGLLKRLHITPISNSEITVSLLLSRGIIMSVQVLTIFFYAVFILDASVEQFDLRFFLWTVFSGAVICSMGLAIASLVRSLEGVEVVTNTLNWVLMFLSGLYFPIFNVPWMVRWIVYLSPITYLVEGYRNFQGLSMAPYPPLLNFLIPLLWFLFFIFVAIKYFKWSEEK